MTRILAASALSLALVAGLTGTASAQSYTAPAGIPAAAAPGGFEGVSGTGTPRRAETRPDRSVVLDEIATTGAIHRPRSAR